MQLRVINRNNVSFRFIGGLSFDRMVSIQRVVLLVQAIQKFLACDKATHVIRLFFIPSVDCSCHDVGQAAQNRNLDLTYLR